MPLALEPEQIASYHADGWLSPLDLLSADQVAAARANLEAFEANHGPLCGRAERSRVYLPFS